ncbi:BatA domain-containing protein [Haloferax namakaokahaiae]|uniref:BatA domain-containing protein n=1 Tax=Haloferax namakaokahaiae TaxID=1748331 RepID=A0ABD5ZFH4_9EURY
MVLDEYVLSPLGLLALLGIVPLVLLYLLRPDPIRRTLPTFQFLADAREQNVSNPHFERLVRSLLLLLQLLAIVALAGTLATPYVLVPESETVSETVLVVDSSASMSVSDGGTTRFEQARDAARNEISGTTTIVAAGADDDVLLRRGTPADARNTLEELPPTAAPGDLRTAISTAMAVAGEDARIVVLSDFADDSPWQDAVREARARGLVVELRQFAGGGSGNVGIIDRRFSGTNVTVSVKNYGDSAVTRTVSLAGTSREVELGAGDVTTATLPVPAGGGELTLSPGDSFALDDRLFVAAPEDASVDVLVLTNDENEYLTAALSVIPEVTLTVDNPPTTVSGDYDVIIYSNVNAERFLRGNREAGQDLLADGGGVAIQAQEEMPDYGTLLLASPREMGSNPSLGSVSGHELTRGITFPPPNRYVVSDLDEGRALVTATDNSPLLAISERSEGRIVYYGFLEDGSAFKYNYQYPVFWKRTVFYLAGRSTLTDLNQATGETLRINENQTVETPRGTASGPEVGLDDAGFYRVGDERFAASLLSEPESDVVAASIEQQEASDSAPVTVEERLVPDPLTEWAALGALGLVLVELGYLRKRGDL